LFNPIKEIFMRTVSALFDTLPQARSTVQDLVTQGFNRDEINLVANATDGELAAEYDEATAAGKTAETVAETGLAVGGLGGLLVGLSFLTIPGIGPVLAAGGLLASIVSGSALGALAGGVVAVLVELGIPEDHASDYAEAIRRGGTMVVVRCPDEAVSKATAVLDQHSPTDLGARSSSWKDTGYVGHDIAGSPYSRDQIETERKVYSAPLVATPVGNPPMVHTPPAGSRYRVY
jgi:uncharacterized membrane protein